VKEYFLERLGRLRDLMVQYEQKPDKKNISLANEVRLILNELYWKI
jgi:hypothetical protein